MEMRRGPREQGLIVIKYDIYTSPSDLPEDEEELIIAAREVMDNAHNPYSGFSVGSAVRTENDAIMTGTNVEQFPLQNTTCAEDNALAKTVAYEGMGKAKKLAVIGTGKLHDTTEPVMPCGKSRQIIMEHEDFRGKPIVILATGKTGDTYRFAGGANSLLPLAFGPKDLGIR